MTDARAGSDGYSSALVGVVPLFISVAVIGAVISGKRVTARTGAYLTHEGSTIEICYPIGRYYPAREGFRVGHCS